MTTKDIVISAETRTETGKNAAGRLRRSGKIPATVYTKGNDARLLQLDMHTMKQLLRHSGGESLMVKLDIEGDKPASAILREVQVHPLSNMILHMDFYEVDKDTKIKVEIQLELTGTPVGVTTGGGIMEVHYRAVEVECLPGQLVSQIDVDVSDVDIGGHISVKDVVIPEGMTLLTDPGISVASVLPPKVAAAETDEEGEGAASAEPEVIGASTDEEEE